MYFKLLKCSINILKRRGNKNILDILEETPTQKLSPQDMNKILSNLIIIVLNTFYCCKKNLSGTTTFMTRKFSWEFSKKKGLLIVTDIMCVLLKTYFIILLCGQFQYHILKTLEGVSLTSTKILSTSLR